MVSGLLQSKYLKARLAPTWTSGTFSWWFSSVQQGFIELQNTVCYGKYKRSPAIEGMIAALKQILICLGRQNLTMKSVTQYLINFEGQIPFNFLTFFTSRYT